MVEVSGCEVEMSSLQPRVGLQGEKPVLCNVPVLYEEGGREEVQGEMTSRLTTSRLTQPPSKEILYRLYWEEGKSLSEIGKILGIKSASVRGWMKNYNILRRNQFVGIAYKKLTAPPKIRIPKEEWKLGYLTGLIDGDGYMFLRVSHGTNAPKGRAWLIPQVGVANTCREVLEWIRNEFGAGKVAEESVSQRQRNRTLSKKPVYYWRITRTADVLVLLKAIRPYLQIKRKDAEQIIAFCESKIQKLKNGQWSYRLEV
jgi:hypothetical protein